MLFQLFKRYSFFFSIVSVRWGEDSAREEQQSIKSSLKDMLENLNKELKSISTNILPPLPIGIEIEQEGDNYVVSDINIYRVDEHYKDIYDELITLL